MRNQVLEGRLLVHDPDHGIEEGLPIGSGWPDASRVRQDQRAGEELMLVLRQRFMPND